MWEKKNVEFLGTEFLSFSPVVTLYFEPELSIGRLDDSITFFNIPALGLIEKCHAINSKKPAFKWIGLHGTIQSVNEIK